MKKVILLSIAIGNFAICEAQEFVFQMKFTDAIGNKDSLTLGYDLMATDSLDAAFGESNTISTAYANGLDVRSGNQLITYFPGFGTTPFESKKQILTNVCPTGNFFDVFPIAEIHIVSPNFPLVASWNSSLFIDTCRNGSVFTSVFPGGWWDTGGFKEVLNSEDSATFEESQYQYLSGTSIINVYWFAFSDSSILTTAVHEPIADNSSIKIFPNPGTDFVTIGWKKTSGGIQNVELINSMGQTIITTEELVHINISYLPNGLYFFKITDHDGITSNHKFQKF